MSLPLEVFFIRYLCVCMWCYCAMLLSSTKPTHTRAHISQTQYEFVDTWSWICKASFIHQKREKMKSVSSDERMNDDDDRICIESKEEKTVYSKWGYSYAFMSYKRQFLIEWMSTVYCDDCFISRIAPTDGKMATKGRKKRSEAATQLSSQRKR